MNSQDELPLDESNRDIGRFIHKIESLKESERVESRGDDLERTKYYKDLLNLNAWSVDQLAIQPGERHFEFWFLISSYFPLIVGTIGPLSNFTNIVALIDSWRINELTGEKVKDVPWLLKLNGISVMFALISNISLLMNTREKMRYTISQVISILGWFIAATILLVLVIVGHFIYFHDNNDFRPSQGYWFALMSMILYYFCFLVLVMNESGFLLKKYPPVFNIDDTQKNLMELIIILMIFLICGAAAFGSIMDLHFTDSLYFVVVTILTVGLGDFVPDSPGGKVLTLFYSVIGLLLLALIISTIRELVIFTASSTFNWHIIERIRLKKLNQLKAQNKLLPGQESFEAMMQVMRVGLLRDKGRSLLLIITMFILFWLLGAVVFAKAEGWDYGTSCYFAFLCLLTIGYGIPSPTTPSGRAFFVVWGLGAVPLMTMLISTMSDILFSSLKDTNNYSLLDPLLKLSEQVLEVVRDQNNKFLRAVKQRLRPLSSETGTQDGETRNLEDEILEFTGSSIEELHSSASEAERNLHSALEMIAELRKLMIISVENPNKQLEYEEWVKLFRFAGDDYKLEHENFWVSDESPFRFPFMQCHFFEFKYLLAIENKLRMVMKDNKFKGLNTTNVSGVPLDTTTLDTSDIQLKSETSNEQ